MPDSPDHLLLADTMTLYFFHRDQAVQFQNQFRSEQQSYIHDMMSQNLSTGVIRTAAVEFEKSSQAHALFRLAMQRAEEAMDKARGWYRRQAGAGVGPGLTNSDIEQDKAVALLAASTPTQAVEHQCEQETAEPI
jgi:hypothetical protein